MSSFSFPLIYQLTRIAGLQCGLIVKAGLRGPSPSTISNKNSFADYRSISIKFCSLHFYDKRMITYDFNAESLYADFFF